MVWTILWFKHHEQEWERRYKTYPKPGLTACSINLGVRHFEKKKSRVNSANSVCTVVDPSCGASLFHTALLWLMTETLAPNLPPAYQDDSNDPPIAVLAVPEVISLDLEPTFELLLTVVYPPKRVRTANRKTKNLKPESENKGPYDVPINITWDAFLGVIAEKLMVGPSSLTVSSFEWHWLKPASSPWLPIQDENGLASMIKKAKSKPEPYVIIRMQAPVQKKATGSLGNAWDAVDELDSDLDEVSVTKKVRIPHHLNGFGTQFLAGKAGRCA